MSRTHDQQTADARATAQKPAGVSHSTPAEDLLLRMGELGGNRAVQRAIEIDVPKRGKGPAPEPRDDRMDAMVVDGVIAFQELAAYQLPIGAEKVPPPLPANIPAGLRPAFGHLQRAKQQHFQAGLPDATQLVRDQLFSEGVTGIAKYVLLGPQLVLQEELQRAYAAKTEWWLARPIFKGLVAKFAATPGADTAEAEKYERMIGIVDREMTETIPGLMAKVIESSVPDVAERMKAVAEAKETIGVLEGIAAGVSGLSDIMSKAAPAVSDRMVGGGIGQDMPKAARFGEPGSKGSDFGPDQEEMYFKVSESTTSANYNKGLAALGKAKSLVGIYSSGQAIGAAIHKLTDEKSTGVEMASASVSLASNLLSPLQEAGELMLTGAAEICDSYASYTRAKHGMGQAWSVAQVENLTSSAGRFRQLAKMAKGLEKVTGVLGVVSSALTLVDGLQKNDSESIIGGGADTLSGIVGVAETFGGVASGTAVFAGVGALQIKTMIAVAADMSRALQAIRNADLREALEGVGNNLNAAARHAQMFDTAMWEWVVRQNSPDEMERTLGEQFAKNAKEQIVDLHNALGSALSSAVQGRISREPSMAKAFSGQFGGSSEARWFLTRLVEKAQITSTGELMTHAEWLKEIFPKVSRGFEAIYLEMKSLDKAAKGKVGLW